MDEYNFCVNRGYEPLRGRTQILPSGAHLDFRIDISLRREIQNSRFGKLETYLTNRVQANQKFYEYAWNLAPHYCEECCIPLEQYSAVYISHILSRSGHPEIAHDLRNFNVLCPKHHKAWESRNNQNMRIYRQNKRIIETLKKEYNVID